MDTLRKEAVKLPPMEADKPSKEAGETPKEEGDDWLNDWIENTPRITGATVVDAKDKGDSKEEAEVSQSESPDSVSSSSGS